MANLDAAKLASKWSQRVGSAGQNYVDGTAAVQEAPGVKAAAAAQTAVQRYTQAIQSGQWAQAVASVPLSSWQASTRAAMSSYTAGSSKGQPKLQRYFQVAAPIIAQNKAQVRAMPNATDADREARMMANLRLMRQLKGVSKR